MSRDRFAARLRRVIQALRDLFLPSRPAAANGFVGNWRNFTYDDRSFMREILGDGAVLTIQFTFETYTVTLAPDGGKTVSVPWTVLSASGKLTGELTLGQDRYYYEIAAPTPPSIKVTRRTIYGILAPILSSTFGDDLGDPGTWQAEDDGTLPEA